MDLASSGLHSVDQSVDPRMRVSFLDAEGSKPAMRAAKQRSFEQLYLRPGSRVLDVGCGAGDDSRRLADMVAPDGKVVAIDGMSATVDFFGVRKELRLDIVDEPVQVGDYVLNHVGFAIRRIPPEEVQETLALFDQILAVTGAKEDLMAMDVRGEMAAGKDKP